MLLILVFSIWLTPTADAATDIVEEALAAVASPSVEEMKTRIFST